ncbi:transcriptional regulator [Pelobium manganitolerans]|uniref:Transcriptional regulator n=1 Tax=Pelobium manganitolerans TaxID=1842495 RepID=A0A419SC25_9SPHI|nr:transcriptional regulator [Pelobium manganitolerans]
MFNRRSDKKWALTLILILAITIVKAQIGIPQINNYSSNLYKGGTQNWEIAQDKNGIMYFANNEGLLSYNGKFWKIAPLPHKTVLRSLAIDTDGKIYVGGQDELGYFFPDAQGVLRYHSLKALLPANEQSLADVWDIVIDGEQIFFRTTSKILWLKNNIFKVFKPKSAWEFLGLANQHLIAQDTERGLMLFKQGEWIPLNNQLDFKNIFITAALSYNQNTILLTTQKNGLFLLHNNEITPWKTADADLFVKNRISDAKKIGSSLFAFASNAAGCYIVDASGKTIQSFADKEGLQKNNVRSIFSDRNQNLWLGFDDGIGFIAFNNAIKYIYPDAAKQTSSYATRVLNGTLYVGTSNGLYQSKLESGYADLSYSHQTFSEINNTQGQVWNLNVINNKLLIGHEEGAYVLNNNAVQQLFHYPGTWVFEPLTRKQPATEIIAGTYNGLRRIVFNQHSFIDAGSIKGFDESMRFLVYDTTSNTIWASHPYRGIYRFTLTADKKEIKESRLFTNKDGLPSLLYNYVTRIKNRVVVATEKGIFEFDEKNQRFSPSKELIAILGEEVYQYLNEDPKGNIWFVTNKKVGVVDFTRKTAGKNYTLVYFPELNGKVVPGFENIYPLNQQNIFIGSTNGLIHINYQRYLKNIKPLNVILTQIKTIGLKDSTIFGGYFLKENRIADQQHKNQKPKLAYAFNSLHFEFSSTLYEQLNNIEFSYQLTGFDETWSDWGSKSEKDYTNLPAGNYTFKVKARNNLGNESAPVVYAFTILPPWYQTWWFYSACFILFLVLIYLLIQRQKRKHLKQQDYLKKTYQLEIEHNEKEIVKLQNEKLENEVNFKNKELATATMHLMQRGKLISRIKEELVPIVKTENLDESPEEFKKILSLINDSERADADWDSFAIHFDHVHSNFLTKLKERVPALSGNDLKLCAYLKMNLSSKEIAQLMSVSNKAVEVSRYRLRKKLNVSSDTNLFDYLIEITS